MRASVHGHLIVSLLRESERSPSLLSLAKQCAKRTGQTASFHVFAPRSRSYNKVTAQVQHTKPLDPTSPPPSCKESQYGRTSETYDSTSPTRARLSGTRRNESGVEMLLNLEERGLARALVLEAKEKRVPKLRGKGETEGSGRGRGGARDGLEGGFLGNPEADEMRGV